MHHWIRTALVATAVAAVAVGAVFATGPSHPPPTTQAASALGTPRAVDLPAAAPPAPPAGFSETSFVPIMPCRAIDTRPSRIPAGATRDFVIRGTARFEAQGGTSGGCGVPAAATGVAVSVSSVTIGGSGYFRIWPYGRTDPGATIAHYQRGPISTTGGTVTLSAPGQGYDVTAMAFDAPAGLVVDVTGYYVPPIRALVDADGMLVAGTRVGRIDYSNNPFSEQYHRYTIQFDRDVAACAPAVQPLAAQSDQLSVVITRVGNYGLTIAMYYDAGAKIASRAFWITVTC